jgi:beta-galactosidase/beta-glucuronidase
MRISTPDIEDDRAVVAVATVVRNSSRVTRTVRLETSIIGSDGSTVAHHIASVTVLPGEAETARARLTLASPQLWSPDSPYLYRAHTTIADGSTTLDEDVTHFGIRKLQLDTEHGLRINGKPVTLRGTGLHHDNGPLGATTIARADERRVEILKAARFNTIRSAHNPISRAMLDACDRLGVLVMDELTDV